jgi:hypothetical protein
MKLVFTREEVAEALGHSTEAFEALLPRLMKAGFPEPVRGLEDRWPIMEVIRWVNREGDASLADTEAELKEVTARRPRDQRPN